MHQSVQDFIAKAVAEYGIADRPTLEVGSLDVNGNPRSHFTGAYCGIDAREGPGVDVVMDAEHLNLLDDHTAQIVTTEALEHMLRPHRVVSEMARVLTPGGYLLATARGFDEFGAWRYHGHPDDHYRFGREAFRVLFTDVGLDVLSLDADPIGPGWFVVARKPLRNVYA